MLSTGAGALEKGLQGDVLGGVEEGVRGVFDLIPSNPVIPRKKPKEEAQPSKEE